MTISSPGIGSGLDVSNIVSQLVAADKKPQQDQIDSRRATVDAQLSALGSLKSVLSSMQSALAGLADGSAFNKFAARVTSADGSDAAFAATTDATATAGSYSIQIDHLAAAQKLSSGAFGTSTSPVGTGTLTVSAGGKSMQLTIDSGNSSLAGIASAINKAADNPGVTAAVVTAADGAHLVLTSTKTGVANAATVTSSGGDGGLAQLGYDPAHGVANLAVKVPASDAQLSIDGFPLTSATNTVTGAISGVTLNLTHTTSADSPQTLSVVGDTTAMATSIRSFVATYNAFVAARKSLASYDVASKTAGPLLGDSTLLGVQSQLSKAFGSLVGSPGAPFRSLGDLGIGFQVDGTLSVDSDKLNTALTTSPTQVAAVFSGKTGIGAQLNTMFHSYLDSQGVFAFRAKSLTDQGKSLDAAQTTLDSRMDAEQAMYNKQFSALDTLLSSMKSTSSFLTQQLNAMTANTSSNK